MPRSSATLEPDETAEEAPQPRSQRARVMSQREADKVKGDLADLIQDAGDYLDWGLTHANRAGAESAVWAFDDEDAEKLAEVWLSRARKSAAAAASVRYVLNQWAYVQVAMLLGGRFIETITFVTENGGLVAPGFVSQRMRFASRTPAPDASSAGSNAGRQRATPGAGAQAVMAAVASAAAQSSRPATQASAQATAAQPGATPTRDYSQAEEAQRAHAARVASLRDGAGTAQESLAASTPPDAPGSQPAPEIGVEGGVEGISA